MTAELQRVIDAAWEERDSIGLDRRRGPRCGRGGARGCSIRGAARVAEKGADGWTVNQWLKKAVLLSFRLNPMEAIPGGPGGAPWWDKVPSKFAGWGAARVRARPASAPCRARSSAAAPSSAGTRC